MASIEWTCAFPFLRDACKQQSADPKSNLRLKTH